MRLHISAENMERMVTKFVASHGGITMRPPTYAAPIAPLPWRASADLKTLFCCIFLMHNEGMTYGYARVSTEAQDLSNQVARLKAAGCVIIYREKIGGAIAERPQRKKSPSEPHVPAPTRRRKG
jgi:hypothetical protein